MCVLVFYVLVVNLDMVVSHSRVYFLNNKLEILRYK